MTSFIQDMYNPINQGIVADYLEEKWRHHPETPRYTELLRKTRKDRINKTQDILCFVQIGTILDLMFKFGDKEDKKIGRRIIKKIKVQWKGKGVLKMIRRKAMIQIFWFRQIFEFEVKNSNPKVA